MSKIKFTLLTLVSTALLLIASASSVFACNIWHYQPETPKSLIR